MKIKAFLIIILIITSSILSVGAQTLDNVKKTKFDKEKDLLLVQFDCKTDVDDIHTAAALFMLLSHSNYKKINYHAVAGSYGMQEGLYVSPNPLFELAFDKKWTDIHENFEEGIKEVKKIVIQTLDKQGNIWIAEAGQSDFTAKLIKLIQSDSPELTLLNRIHTVQHSDWNEKNTSPEALDFVKQNSNYYKSADGNTEGNGTPGFNMVDFKNWQDGISDPKLLKIWNLAIDLGNYYNGKEGRYNNKTVSEGGLDFSDLVEVCWILGLNNIKDTKDFFDKYSI